MAKVKLDLDVVVLFLWTNSCLDKVFVKVF